MGVFKKKMGGFLVTTLILGSLVVSCMLILFTADLKRNKYYSKVRLISYADCTENFEFKIEKFYGFLKYLEQNGKLDSFFDEEMQGKMKEEGFLNYQVDNINEEVVLIFEKDKYFNYNVIFGYNRENQVKFMIKNIQETRKNQN